MEKREKVKQVYKKLGIIVEKGIIDSILENQKVCKDMLKLYESMRKEEMLINSL